MPKPFTPVPKPMVSKKVARKLGMSQKRATLKARKVLQYPICVVRGPGCTLHSTDLHEVIITRKEVMGCPQAIIDAVLEAEWNPLPTCNHCNLYNVYAARKTLTELLVREYGKSFIIREIKALGMVNPGDFVRAVEACEDWREDE